LQSPGAGQCSTAYGRAVNRATAVINNACKPGNPVLENYPGADVAGSVFPAVTRLLERNAQDLQGLPSFTGDKSEVKAKGKCHKAIGAGRSSVILGIVKTSTKCQKGRDKSATEFGAIASDCVAGAGSAGHARAARSAARADLSPGSRSEAAHRCRAACSTPLPAPVSRSPASSTPGRRPAATATWSSARSVTTVTPTRRTIARAPASKPAAAMARSTPAWRSATTATTFRMTHATTARTPFVATRS
jgi:hypothetical protein